MFFAHAIFFASSRIAPLKPKPRAQRYTHVAATPLPLIAEHTSACLIRPRPDHFRFGIFCPFQSHARAFCKPMMPLSGSMPCMPRATFWKLLAGPTLMTEGLNSQNENFSLCVNCLRKFQALGFIDFNLCCSLGVRSLEITCVRVSYYGAHPQFVRTPHTRTVKCPEIDISGHFSCARFCPGSIWRRALIAFRSRRHRSSCTLSIEYVIIVTSHLQWVSSVVLAQDGAQAAPQENAARVRPGIDWHARSET